MRRICVAVCSSAEEVKQEEEEEEEELVGGTSSERETVCWRRRDSQMWRRKGERRKEKQSHSLAGCTPSVNERWRAERGRCTSERRKRTKSSTDLWRGESEGDAEVPFCCSLSLCVMPSVGDARMRRSTASN